MNELYIISFSPATYDNDASLRYNETTLPEDGYGAKYASPPELFKVYPSNKYHPLYWYSHVYVPKTNLIDGIRLLQRFLSDKYGRQEGE